MSNLTFARLGPYQLLSLLGVGGMSEIYRAHDPRLDREVAIKVLPVDLARQPGLLERFRREARVVARLDHPNIMPIYDFGEDDGVLYVVMPLIEGGTLRDRITRHGACALREAATMLYQVALALQEAHQHGLVHRDVKPANILMAPDERAVLADFGIACVLADPREKGITQVGMGIGTAEYMSPEQACGEPVDHRADVYALGVVLFQALTGRVPFQGADAFATATMQVQAAPLRPRSINPTIPAEVEEIILRALEKDPADRFQSAAAFAVALADATPWLDLPLMQQARRGPVPASRPAWIAGNAWDAPVNGGSLTEPQLRRPLGARAPDQPAGLFAMRAQPGSQARIPGDRGWVVLFSALLAVLVIVGAFAVIGALGALRNKTAAGLTPAAQQPQPTSAPPQPTATPAPVTTYYLAQFFVLMQNDLQQGDRLGQTISIENNQYQQFEGPKGTLYLSGDATQFGRAFGTGTEIHTQAGALRFVVLADRFNMLQNAQQYYQEQVGLLSQTAAASAGQQAATGLGRITGDQASYRLILLDRNIVVILATPRIAQPQAFQAYFAQLALLIDQRGHRCQFNANLQAVAGAPALCSQA